MTMYNAQERKKVNGEIFIQSHYPLAFSTLVSFRFNNNGHTELEFPNLYIIREEVNNKVVEEGRIIYHDFFFFFFVS
jgi:hypothetical protein